METLLWQAKEDKDLFWLSMGYFSSDGEKDEDFNEGSQIEDSFDSDFDEQPKRQAKRASKEN